MAYGIEHPIERVLERDLEALQGQIDPKALERISRQVEAGVQAAKSDFVRHLARTENSTLSEEMKDAALARAHDFLGAQLQIQVEVVRSYLGEARTGTN